jgi:hypothetical protein
MAYTLMAPNTVKFIIVDHTVRGNFADKIAVAKQAVCVQYFGIPRLDADRITKNPVGECDGMMIAVACLRHPLTDEIVRHVAVVAGREGMVAGFLPTIKVLAHNVAIDAYLGFIRYVGCSAPGIKSKSTSAQKNANQHIEQQFHACRTVLLLGSILKSASSLSESASGAQSQSQSAIGFWSFIPPI